MSASIAQIETTGQRSADTRRSQTPGDWPLARRLPVVRRLRHAVADDPLGWAQSIAVTQQRTLAESVGAEVWALADACRFLERHAEAILAPSIAPGGRWRNWITGLRVRIHHQPRGRVLVIGAGNYPLLLSAVPALQALVAGNRVLLKPPPAGEACCRRFVETLKECGLPQGMCQLLDPSPQAAQQAIANEVDHVVFTGSSRVGHDIWRQATTAGVTCTLELSGCDAVVVLAGANIERVAQCLAFGLDFNASATCIAPRRVYGTRDMLRQVERRLCELLAGCQAKRSYSGSSERAAEAVREAIAAGARIVWPADRSTVVTPPGEMVPTVLSTNNRQLPLLQHDLFAAVLTLVEVDSDAAAVTAANDTPWGLGASVFGPPQAAEAVATQLAAGCVTINDLVAPTADARVPFGGWNQSGHGVTRGREGLLEMTRPQVTIVRRGRWLPHLDRQRAGLAALVAGLVKLLHGRNLATRLAALGELRKAVGNDQSANKETDR
jgi:acyl-CoA reductase-like NAD-dependent aldehyde dehydrogenase